MADTSGRENGFNWDDQARALEIWYFGTQSAQYNDDDNRWETTAAFTATTTITVAGDDGDGVGVTTGNSVNTAGDERITAGNLRLGAVEVFGMTEPTSALVMKTGTAPVGAIATSGGLFSSSTVVRKIIAAGTASNVEA